MSMTDAADEPVPEVLLRTSLEAAELSAFLSQAAERRMAALTDALPVLISQVGRDLRYEFVNRAYEEWFGRTREDLRGRALAEVLGPEVLTRIGPQIEAALSGQSVTFEQSVRYPRMGLRDVRTHYVPNVGTDGDVIGFFTLVQDITEAKQHADLLAQRERHLRAVMDSVTDCFYAVDRDWRITLFNKSAERYYGKEREQVLGRKLWDVFPAHVGSVFEQQLQTVMDERVPVTFEARSAVFPDRYIEMRVAPKEASGIAVSFSDISVRKAQEQQRELLINELNHRVKNTLAVVQSMAAQSLRDDRVPREVRASFEGRLIALAAAHDLLTRANWEAADLGAAVRAALEPFDQEHRFEVAGPDLRVRPQAAVNLTLALHELATNASKYGALSNKTGTVTVTWDVSEAEPPMFRLLWRESGGPEVTAPSRSGFGSRLIQRGLSGELGGPAVLDFARDGLVCSIEAPIANLQAQPEKV